METEAKFRATVCDRNGELHNYYGSLNDDLDFFSCVALMNLHLCSSIDYIPVHVTYEFIEPEDPFIFGSFSTDRFVDLSLIDQLTMKKF